MKKLTQRVCSHTEPPPPDGNGKKYDICARCATPWRQRKQYSSGHRPNWTLITAPINAVLKFKDDQKKFPMRNPPLFRAVAREFNRLQTA